MKRLSRSSRWECARCGFEADGQTWNERWLRDYGVWGAKYSCPNCKREVDLKQTR